jgi:hypothetical protein
VDFWRLDASWLEELSNNEEDERAILPARVTKGRRIMKGGKGCLMPHLVASPFCCTFRIRTPRPNVQKIPRSIPVVYHGNKSSTRSHSRA